MDETDDDLLRRVACGELSATDEAVAARRERDDDFARALDELDRTRRLLDGVGAAERDLIEGAITEASEADVRLVHDSLRAALVERRSPRRRRPLGAILAAAAAVLLVALAARAALVGPEGDGLPPGVLSGDARIVAPREEVETFDVLELDYDALASSKSVVVEVVSVETGDVFVRHEELGSGRWTFSDEQRERMRAAGRVRIVVTLVPRVGDEEEFSAEAWLSR
ncbi:MAG: hypothetical protein AAF957_10785 [Planctomycetota bacterium]